MTVPPFRPAVGPTRPPVEWVQRAVPPASKRPGDEAGHSAPSNDEAKNEGSYISTFPCTSMAHTERNLRLLYQSHILDAKEKFL
jgi:hypothetical protein